MKVIKWIFLILFWPITLPVWLIRQLFKKKNPHENFVEKALNVYEGMSQSRVLEIMKATPNSRSVDGNNITLSWEFNQQLRNGNFIKRALRVTFVNDIATSIIRENFDIDTKKI